MTKIWDVMVNQIWYNIHMEKKIELALYWKRMAEKNPDIFTFNAEEFGLTEEDIALAEAEALETMKYLQEIRNSYLKPKRECAKREEAAEVKEEIKKPAEKRKRKTPRKTDPEIRQKVIDRDKCCVLCGETEGLEVHHIKYRSEGGTDDMNNLVTLCKRCHAIQHEGEPIYYLMAASCQHDIRKIW